MRFCNSLLLALPAVSVVAAADQQPLADTLRGWFDAASKVAAEYLPTTVPSVHLPDPLDAGAAKVADLAVTHLNLTNWQSVLSPSVPTTKGGPEQWLVYINGGNKTCYGLCGNTTKAWNTAAALLTTTSGAPKLASVDCETEGVLCHQWAVTPPSIYHIVLPRAAADVKPVVRYIPLNHTSTTASDITELYTKKTYQQTEPYVGYWEPFSGLLATTGLSLPVGYVLYYFAKLPSWAPMIILSFASRTFMNKRMPRGAPATAAPAAAPAAPK